MGLATSRSAVGSGPDAGAASPPTPPPHTMSQDIDPLDLEWRNRAVLAQEAGVPPGVHSLWIINKSGGLVYHKTYADIPHIDVNETMRLASMWCAPPSRRPARKPPGPAPNQAPLEPVPNGVARKVDAASSRER